MWAIRLNFRQKFLIFLNRFRDVSSFDEAFYHFFFAFEICVKILVLCGFEGYGEKCLEGSVGIIISFCIFVLTVLIGDKPFLGQNIFFKKKIHSFEEPNCSKQNNRNCEKNYWFMIFRIIFYFNF